MKRILITLVALTALYLIYDEFKGDVIQWYVSNYVPRPTDYPSSPEPDQICLTISGDPRTTMAVQWRTSPAVADGAVQYQRTDEPEAAPKEIPAEQTVIEDPLVENDPANHRFTAVLTGLAPGTEYRYRVGAKANGAWSQWASFTTAPDGAEPFTFMYLGDPQKGIEEWGPFVNTAFERHPDVRFNVIAGDLVNAGNRRNQWDTFFNAGQGFFSHCPVAPALGNHDYDEDPDMYIDLFALPEDGPGTLPPERAYSFDYGNVQIVVLDSNQPPREQTEWLESTLEESDATWTLAMYHHPAYPSAPHRSNPDVKEYWGALFDEYSVDMALQGHDHAYLRTYPMHNGERVSTAAEGTYYAVAVSGSKYYEQLDHDYAEVAFAETPTYQIISIDTNPDQLTYRAYDASGAVRDEVVLTK